MTAATRFAELYIDEGMTQYRVPEEMFVGDANGWARWRPIASTVSRSALEQWQAEHEVRLPPPFCELLLERHWYDFEVQSIQFYPHPPGWERWLRHGLSVAGVPEIENRKMFSIGRELNNGAEVCFELESAGADGDCPVQLIIHREPPQLAFSSTAKMFEAFCALKSGGKAAFFAADPGCAGGPGREHWERVLRVP